MIWCKIILHCPLGALIIKEQVGFPICNARTSGSRKQGQFVRNSPNFKKLALFQACFSERLSHMWLHKCISRISRAFVVNLISQTSGFPYDKHLLSKHCSHCSVCIMPHNKTVGVLRLLLWEEAGTAPKKFSILLLYLKSHSLLPPA